MKFLGGIHISLVISFQYMFNQSYAWTNHVTVKSYTTSSTSSTRSPIMALQAEQTKSTTNQIVVEDTSRRQLFNQAAAAAATVVVGTSAVGTVASLSPLFIVPQPANAIGPVKITLIPISYRAALCPPNKPIPGQKAMVGMKGMCVTVVATLQDKTPKELEKVGVYGFVTDGITGDSVLANNPDLSTDAGQFAMIETVKPSDTQIQFEFIAAIPYEKDIQKYDNGIGPLNFDSLRIISYPGGQQFGEINPCEMNEFSPECEDWEAINGPYEKQEYMMKSKKVR